MADVRQADEGERRLPSGALPGIPEGDTERLLKSVAEELVRLLKSKSQYLVLAESCTAGLLADALARIPGASACFWGSFVCYTFRAKTQMLGLGEEQLNKYGLVSEETARAMALGALKKSGADAAVSVTGIAGPDGDGSGVPVGTVWIATALRNPEGDLRSLDLMEFPEDRADFCLWHRRGSPDSGSVGLSSASYGMAEAVGFHFGGSRNRVREQAAQQALEQIIIRLKKNM